MSMAVFMRAIVQQASDELRACDNHSHADFALPRI
jgi:hypothetical protein